MPKCTDELVEFGRAGERVVEASFDGWDIVSDGGVLSLGQVDERPGLTRAAARASGDGRLAPYVFAGQDLLACVLRPSDRDPASVLSALIERPLVRLRRARPKTKRVVSADSGFCRPRVLQRLARWGVSYVIGLRKNSRLAQEVELAELALAEQCAHKQTKQRMFGEFEYAARTWESIARRRTLRDCRERRRRCTPNSIPRTPRHVWHTKTDPGSTFACCARIT